MAETAPSASVTTPTGPEVTRNVGLETRSATTAADCSQSTENAERKALGGVTEAVPTCVFCARIAAGDCTRHDRGVVSFEPLDPVVPGHRLFVPDRHVEDACDEPWITAQVMEIAAFHARRGMTDCNLITSVGPLATQTIYHLHVHYVPRLSGDGLPLPWTPQQERESR